MDGPDLRFCSTIGSNHFQKSYVVRVLHSRNQQQPQLRSLKINFFRNSKMRKPAIVIIGEAQVGKTTVAKALSEYYNHLLISTSTVLSSEEHKVVDLQCNIIRRYGLNLFFQAQTCWRICDWTWRNEECFTRKIKFRRSEFSRWNGCDIKKSILMLKRVHFR